MQRGESDLSKLEANCSFYLDMGCRLYQNCSIYLVLLIINIIYKSRM